MTNWSDAVVGAWRLMESLGVKPSARKAIEITRMMGVRVRNEDAFAILVNFRGAIGERSKSDRGAKNKHAGSVLGANGEQNKRSFARAVKELPSSQALIPDSCSTPNGVSQRGTASPPRESYPQGHAQASGFDAELDAAEAAEAAAVLAAAQPPTLALGLPAVPAPSAPSAAPSTKAAKAPKQTRLVFRDRVSEAASALLDELWPRVEITVRREMKRDTWRVRNRRAAVSLIAARAGDGPPEAVIPELIADHERISERLGSPCYMLARLQNELLADAAPAARRGKNGRVVGEHLRTAGDAEYAERLGREFSPAAILAEMRAAASPEDRAAWDEELDRNPSLAAQVGGRS